MRTLVNNKESSQYVLHIQDVFPEERAEKGNEFPESSFYDFAAIHDATFSGYVEMKKSKFVESL